MATQSNALDSSKVFKYKEGPPCLNVGKLVRPYKLKSPLCL